MKYGYLQKLMWCVFSPGFKKNLNLISADDAKATMRSAHGKYKKILSDVQEFDKDDRFILNIISAAMLATVYLSLDKKPAVEALTDYYASAMDNFVMSFYLKHTDRYTFTYQNALREDAEKSKRRNNPYSWVYDYQPGEDLNRFTATFHACGICHLLNSLGIGKITPALCRYDYTMAQKSGSEFTREYTIASGGAFCDCHYRKSIN